MDQNSLKTIEKLDHLFELLLVLHSIISAAIFQFRCTIPYEDSEVGREKYLVSLRFDLRFLFVPLIVVIAFWFVARVAKRQTPSVLLVKLFAWNYSLLALVFNMLVFVLVGFPLLGFPAYFSFGILALVTIVVVYFAIAKLYEKAMGHRRFKTDRYILLKVLVSVGSMLFLVLSYIVAGL